MNGAFELSSNRRDVWFGDDMAGEVEKAKADLEAWLNSEETVLA